MLLRIVGVHTGIAPVLAALTPRARTGGQALAEDQTLSRRQFFNTAVNAIGVVITAIVAIPVTGYFIDPALKRATGHANWVKLASMSQLSATPTAFTLSAERVEGFMKQRVNATVYAFLLGGQPIALSNICTHLGCPVSWNAGQDQYLCPCHGGVYDKTGKNIAGPPPKPLPRFSTRVEGDDLLIQVI